MSTSFTPPVIVLCPLAWEASVLRRALRETDIPVSCCGPGPDAVEQWLNGALAAASPRLIVLVGLAGALGSRCPAGTAYMISEVRDPSGTVIARRRSIGLHPDQLVAQATLTQAPTIVTSDAARSALARSSGADLVDTESITFTRLVEARGWPWAIIRGVSDDAHTPLPAAATGWVDAHGAVRTLAVARWVLRRPGQMPALARLRRHSAAALRACAALVKEVCISPPDQG
jgi:nucleoside phosphorylase